MMTDVGSYADLRNVVSWLLKRKSFVGASFSGWAAFQFGLLIAIFHGYTSNWPATLVPTYVFLFVAFVSFILCVYQTNITVFTLDIVSTAIKFLTVIQFVVLLSVKLSNQGSFSFVVLFLPTLIVAFIVFSIYFCLAIGCTICHYKRLGDVTMEYTNEYESQGEADFIEKQIKQREEEVEEDKEYIKKIATWVFKWKAAIISSTSFLVWLQFLLLIMIFYNYTDNWAGVLTPSYVASFLSYFVFIAALVQTRARILTWDNISILIMLTGFLIFVILLAIKLTNQEAMSFFTLFFPSGVIFIAVFVIYFVRAFNRMHELEYTSEESLISHYSDTEPVID
jgi:hypothetical protein